MVEELRSGKSKYALDVQGFGNAPIYGLKLVDCTFENVVQGSVVANLKGFALQNVRINGKVIEELG